MSGGVDVRVIDRDGTPIPAMHHHFQEVIPPEQHVNINRNITSVDLDLARRLITGQRAFFFFGFNDEVDAAWEDVWAAGGDIPWLTAATLVEIISTNSADVAGGIGVQSVEIHGLGPTGEDQSEVIPTNGTNAVVSKLTYIRINKMHNQEVGTYGGSHEGNVTCQVVSGGAVLSTMIGREGAVNLSVQYGLGEAGNGFWSVPKGKVAYITDLVVTPNIKGNQTMDVILYEREGITDITDPFLPRRVLWSAIEIGAEVSKRFKSHIKVKQLTDIFFRAQNSGTGGKVAVSLDFYLLDQNADGE